MAEWGYVDLQINGSVGVEFSAPDLTEDDFLRAADHILSGGTELFLPTLVTGPKEVFLRNIPLIRRACETRGLVKQIPGVHMEGPFISPEPGAVGSHPKAFVREPDPAFLEDILRESGDFVRLLTVAAERPGAEDLIRFAKGKGIAVSCGHQLAQSADLKCAASAGATLLTHLGNGCPNLIDRHRNVIWAGLACDELTAMIITDGHHLPGEVIKCILRCKGAEKVIVTSDAAPVAGLPPGRYSAWGNDAVLEPDGLYHNPELHCLVGSSASMRECVRFLRSLELLTEAELKLVSRTNPLKVLGVTL